MSIVIKENGYRFVFEEFVGPTCHHCNGCQLMGKEPSHGVKACGLCFFAANEDGLCMTCTSATKITEAPSTPKIYGPHNIGDAERLIGQMVEGYHGSGWHIHKLKHMKPDDSAPYILSSLRYGVAVIREIQTRRMTQAEFRKTFGVSYNIEIVEEKS